MKQKNLFFIVAASSVGSVLEMYDFVIYIIMASIITKLFFPNTSAYLALLQVFAIFAVGYLSRPLGGVVFGHIGDRYGRQRGLVLSMMFMGIPIFLIGCLPTYAVLGGLAPLLLLLLRFLAGISVGGEYPSGMTYLCEHAPDRYRAFVSSFLCFGVNLGILLASWVGTFITKNIAPATLMNWGWRVPFWLGGVLAIMGYFLRRKLQESPIFLQYQQSHQLSRRPMLEMLHYDSRQVARTFTFVGVMAAAISLVFLFMPVYLNQFLHRPLAAALEANTLNLFIFSCLIPFFAWLSDLTSRNLILSMGAYFFLFLSLPLYNGIIAGSALVSLLCLLSLGVISAMIVGPMGATLAERFRNRHRTSGIGLSYNLSFGLVGGLAPLAVTYLWHLTKTNLAPAFYLMMTALLALIAIINLHDFARSPAAEVERELNKLGKNIPADENPS